jgi:hypothetical protein
VVPVVDDAADHDGAALLLLEEQLRREQRRIEERRTELEASRELLARLTSRSLGAHEPLLEPVSTALAPSVVGRLLSETTGVIRNLVLTVEEGPAFDDATIRGVEERLRRGDQQRSVYPASALGNPHGQRWLTSWAEAGEDQRIVPATETEFAVFGETAVVALARWDDLHSGYVVIRDPLVVRLYLGYFDLVWRHAAPVPTGRDRTADTKLVELLELGMKDEAIARYLGVSLRTVRRRVAGLMTVNGVDTRFQLGWVLGRRRR